MEKFVFWHITPYNKDIYEHKAPKQRRMVKLHLTTKALVYASTLVDAIISSSCLLGSVSLLHPHKLKALR